MDILKDNEFFGVFISVVFLLCLGVPLVFLLFRGYISLKPYKAKSPERDQNIQATKTTVSWAEANGFSLLGFYSVRYGIMCSFMAAWKSQDRPMYLCQYMNFRL